MAAIHEELTLADRFSATFTRYLGMLRQSTGASAEAAAGQRRFSAASGGAGDALAGMAGAAQAASSAMGGVDGSTAQAASSCQRASRSQERMNRSLRQGSAAAAGLEGRLLALARAYLGLRAAQAFVGLADTFTQTTARLERMNDGLQTTAELQDMVYQAAQRSRGSYQETADMVAKLGTMAGEAFGSSAELVAFAEQINKQFALAGTSAQGIQAAMLQLTQAMSSGVLRGEELNSVLEQAPTIAQAIAKYMGVSVGGMRELASEGKITASVVKNALFSAAEETNAAFEKVPLTFGQAWTMAGSAAVKAMRPAMTKLNDLLNSELGQRAVNGLIAGFELLGSAAAGAVDLLAAGARWAADNWALVSTALRFAGGALAALAALSAASAMAHAAAWAAANWPLLLLIALVGAAVMAMYAMGMSSEEVFAAIGAGLGALYAFGYNLVASAWNLIASFGEFFATFLDNPAAAIVHLLADLADFALSILQTIAGAIDAVFGSSLAGAVNGWRAGVQQWADGMVGEKKVTIERMELLDVRSTMDEWAGAGAGLGRAVDNFSVDDLLGGFSGANADFSAMLDASGVPGALDGIKGDTAAIKRSVSLSEEDMKLLVDMAERQYVSNVYLTAQTPVITINGQNTGSTEADLRWLEDALQRILAEQAASHTALSYQ